MILYNPIGTGRSWHLSPFGAINFFRFDIFLLNFRFDKIRCNSSEIWSVPSSPDYVLRKKIRGWESSCLTSVCSCIHKHFRLILRQAHVSNSSTGPSDYASGCHEDVYKLYWKLLKGVLCGIWQTWNVYLFAWPSSIVCMSIIWHPWYPLKGAGNMHFTQCYVQHVYHFTQYTFMFPF